MDTPTPEPITEAALADLLGVARPILSDLRKKLPPEDWQKKDGAVLIAPSGVAKIAAALGLDLREKSAVAESLDVSPLDVTVYRIARLNPRILFFRTLLPGEQEHAVRVLNTAVYRTGDPLRVVRDPSGIYRPFGRQPRTRREFRHSQIS